MLSGAVLPGSTIDIQLEEVEQILGGEQQAGAITAEQYAHSDDVHGSRT
jgi:hypothetical protein